MDLFLRKMQLFASHEFNWWTGVVWIIVMFYQPFELSFWRHPLTLEDTLVSDVKLSFFESVLMKKLIQLHLRWPKGKYIFIFWENYLLKSLQL